MTNVRLLSAEHEARTSDLVAPYAGALADYKARMGRRWKDQLISDWMTDNRRQWGLLRSLRNDGRFLDFDDIFKRFAAYEKAQKEVTPSTP